jgi:hypothetical protein
MRLPFWLRHRSGFGLRGTFGLIWGRLLWGKLPCNAFGSYGKLLRLYFTRLGDASFADAESQSCAPHWEFWLACDKHALQTTDPRNPANPLADVMACRWPMTEPQITEPRQVVSQPPRRPIACTSLATRGASVRTERRPLQLVSIERGRAVSQKCLDQYCTAFYPRDICPPDLDTTNA